MIVSTSELAKVKHGRPRRRQMLLPVELHSTGARLPCPVEFADEISLQPRHGLKGTKVTVINVELSFLGAMSEPHAKQQGYTSLPAARDAFDRQHGESNDQRLVYIVQFALGMHRAALTEHAERYLKAKGVGLTTDPDRAARGEGAVPSDLQLAYSRKAADEREASHLDEYREQREVIKSALATLRTQEMDKLVQSELNRLERRLDRIDDLVSGRPAA